jgi:N12 class adenine-specific DNA methylase
MSEEEAREIVKKREAEGWYTPEPAAHPNQAAIDDLDNQIKAIRDAPSYTPGNEAEAQKIKDLWSKREALKRGEPAPQESKEEKPGPEPTSPEQEEEEVLDVRIGEPDADAYYDLSEKIAEAQKDPAFREDTREGQQLRDKVIDMERDRDFHKPAAIERARKQIEDEKAGKPPTEEEYQKEKEPKPEPKEEEPGEEPKSPEEGEQKRTEPNEPEQKRTEEEPGEEPKSPEEKPKLTISPEEAQLNKDMGLDELIASMIDALENGTATTNTVGYRSIAEDLGIENTLEGFKEWLATQHAAAATTEEERPAEGDVKITVGKMRSGGGGGGGGRSKGSRTTRTGHTDSLEEVSPEEDGKAEEGGEAGAGGDRGPGTDPGRGPSPDKTEPGPGLGTGDATGEGTVRVPPGGGTVPGGKRKVDKAESGRDFRLTDETLADLGGPAERFEANLAAIELLKKLEKEDRLPTPEEQRVLARYVGWGGLSQVAFAWSGDRLMEQRRDRLRRLLTDEEYRAASASSTNAHYTSLPVARQIWAGLQRLGVKAGMRMLEPSAGTGIFFGSQPESLLPAWRNGVELDNITAGIAKKLYPDSKIQNLGYQKAGFPNNYFHYILGNVPFGKYGVSDPAFRGKPSLTKAIHNYFFAKALEQVKPGGIVAFVTSRYTMDQIDSTVRAALAEKADLIGAIRLPGGRKGAFAGNAGTQVTTDIIFLRRRRSDESPSDVKWVKATGAETREGEDEFKINEYFVANPDMMLGKMTTSGSMYRPNELTLEGEFDENDLAKAIAKLPEGVMNTSADGGKTFDPVALTEETAKIKPGGFGVDENGVLVRRTAEGIVPANVKPEAEKRIRGMMGIRDALKAVYRSQLLDKTDEELAAARKELNKLYDAFVKAYGPVSSPNNARVFSEDPEYPTIRSIEDYDSDTGKSKKRDVFTKRTIPIYHPPERVSNAQDALGVVLAERGFLDWKRLESVTNKDRETLLEELGDQVFENPSGDWEVSDEYLSGEVVKKLKEAESAAKSEPNRYGRNVEALRKVQPTPLTKDEINVKPGASWIPGKDIKGFMDEIIFGLTGWDLKGSKARADYSHAAAQWTIIAPSKLTRSTRNQDYNPNFTAAELFEMSLNTKKPKVYFKKTHPDEKPRLNMEATAKAEDAQERLVEAFEQWLWADEARKKRLLDTYNEEYNGVRLWEPNGEHLKFPGMARSMLRGEDLDKHQKNGVWRIIRAGNALLAHVVGAGKTFTMIAAGMEMKRMGLIDKPMYVVPNHLVEQWGQDFLKLYPNANILVADPETFGTGLRQETAGKIAAGNYDAIILSHKSFEALPISDATFQRFVEKETAEILAELDRLQDIKADNEKKGPTVKRLETQLANLQAQLLKRALMEAKDKAIEFESLGVDQLFVDEAHMFKNLGFYTSMGRVAGLPQSNANRSFDMLMKTQYLSERQGNRGVVFATGTPIANSMAEMYTMMRYLAGPYMKEKGLEKFDAWARQFGRVVRAVELSPEGGKFRMNNRFAKFVNVADLVKGFRTFADVKNVEDLNLPRPELEGGKAETIVNPSHPLLSAFVRLLGRRAEMIRGGQVDPKDDNMLKITFEGRVAALDIRLYAEAALEEARSLKDDVIQIETRIEWLGQERPGETVPNRKRRLADLGIAKKELHKAKELVIAVAPYLKDPSLVHKEKGGKITMVADKVASIYKETAKEKSTQLVFLDLGTPKEKSKKRQAAEETADNPDEIEVDEEAEGRVADEEAMQAAAYDEIKKKLIAQGVKAEEIAFIHDAKNKDQKQALFKKVNAGTIRILIGSTEKMGAGTNVQERLKALHHVDVPWRPSDIEQREGRILRQGNTNASVRIFNYASEGSFDVYMWQTIGSKADMIHTAMSGDLSVREIEDMSTMALSAKETIALSSGDPVVQERLDVETKVNKLRREKRNNQDAHRQWAESLAKLEWQTQRNRTRLEAAKSAAEKVVKWLEENPETPPRNFTGIPTEELTSAPLSELLTKVSQGGGGPVGTLGPFEMSVGKSAFGGASLEVEDGVDDFSTSTWTPGPKGRVSPEVARTVLGALTNYWNSLPGKVDTYKEWLDRSQAELDTFESAKPDKFKKEDELAAAEKRLDEITDELGLMDDAAPSAEDEGGDEGGAPAGGPARGGRGPAPAPAPKGPAQMGWTGGLTEWQETVLKVIGRGITHENLLYSDEYAEKQKEFDEAVADLIKAGIIEKAYARAGGALSYRPVKGAKSNLEKLDAAGRLASERLKPFLGGGTLHSTPKQLPGVIRDMAISIAGDVARLLINGKNFLAKIVQKFGSAARPIARRVYRRALRIVQRSRQAGQAVSAGWRQGATAGAAPAAATQQATPATAPATPAAPLSASAQALKEYREDVEASGRRVDKGTPWYTRLRERMTELGHSFTREYTHLPPGATYAPVRMELKKVNAAKQNSEHRAHQALKDQLESMTDNPIQLEQMMDVIVLDDLWWRVETQMNDGYPVEDSDLPWNLTKKKLALARAEARRVAAANPKIDKALRLRKAMQREIRLPLIKAFRDAGYKDLSDALSNPDYFRHRVMEYEEKRDEGTGGGQRFKLPVGRGYLRKAWVNPKEYSLDYMRTEWQVMNQMMFDTSRAQFLAYIRNPKNKLNIAKDVQKKAAELNKDTVMPHFDRLAKHWNKTHPKGTQHTGETMYQKVMKSHPQDPGYRERLTKQLAGKHYMTFKKTFKAFFADTHGIYQPVDGEHFYLANSIPEQIAEEAALNGVAEVKKEQIRRVVARGQRREELVLPKELIKTIQGFSKPEDPKSASAIAQNVWGIPTNLWKQSRLIGPTGVVIYNARNASGDLWRVTTVLPKAFKHLPRVWRDLKAFRKTGKPPNKEFEGWWQRGGFQSNIQSAEMGDIKVERKMREALVEINPTMSEQAKRALSKTWDAIWWGRKYTDMREALLRYATFLEFLEQVKTGGRPTTFAASLRDEVMALTNPMDRAYKLSNDMMLAYDEVSPAGKIIRKYPIPFYSFTEQNARTHWRLMKNAAADGRESAALGYALLGGTRQAVHMGVASYIYMGRTAALMSGLKILMTAINWGLWDDDEDDIPDSVKKDTHILLGRDSEGRVLGFTRIGLVDELLEWAGLNAAPYYAREYLNGRMTLQEWAVETAKAPFNKFAGGLTPWFKYPAELWAGKSMFPDVFNPRTIRDRGQYIFRELGLLYPYNYMMKNPQPPPSWRNLLKLVLYSWEPKQTHYNSFRYDKVPGWSAEHGGMKSRGAYSDSPAAEALYLIRESVRYGDHRGLIHGLDDYKNAGGTIENLEKAIDRLHPLGALTEASREEYRASLRGKERAQLHQAELFWKVNFDNKRAELTAVAESRNLPAKRVRKKK